MIIFSFHISIILAIIGFLLIVCALLLKKTLFRTQRVSGLPLGNVVYNDLVENGNIFISHEYPISGKPDYIMKRKKSFIPVEVKSGNHHLPLTHHCMQLACYCHLVSETYQTQVPYGILVYPNTGKQFNIPYDTDIENKLHLTLYHMHQLLQGDYALLDPSILYVSKKCKTCSMKSYCDISKNRQT